MEKKIICSHCKNENVIKWTKRKTENRGLIQRYKCNNCNKTFVLDDGFFRMRNAPQKVTCAIDLFYRGVSTRKVQEHFKAFYPHNANHTSILRWIRKYSVMISKFTEKLKLSVGAEVQIAFVEIILLWLSIFSIILIVNNISRKSSWLLVPYLIWVAFATVLNCSIAFG